MADDHKELEARIRWMATQVVKQEGNLEFDELDPVQQYLIMEQAALWIKYYQQYNAKFNIVEAQVDDSIFGFDEEDKDG